MKMAISAVSIIILAIISCISADSNCKMLTTNDDRHGVYSCVQATLDDILKIPGETEWLRFTVTKLRSIPSEAFATWPALRGLSFYNCQIGHIDPNAFDRLYKLERLTFYGSNIHVLKASWFKELRSLTHLFLNRNDMVYIEPNVFSLIPNLVELNIEDNNINCLASQALTPLRKLRHARIGKNPWLCSCYMELVGWLKNRQIDYGLISTTRERLECMMERVPQFSDFMAPPYKTFKKFSALENGYIRISPGRDVLCFGNNISALSQIPDNVRSIKFVNSEIAKIPRFAFLRFGNSLTSLYFHNCSIRHIHPSAFAGLPKLEILSVVNNSFSIMRSEWFKDLHSLENLALDENGIEHIETDVFPLLDKLKYWSLSKNRIQCISTNEFDSLKLLEQVVLAHNPWNCSCQESFRKWLHVNRVRYVVSLGKCTDGLIQESEDLFEQSFERQGTKTNSQNPEPTSTQTTPKPGRLNQTSTELYEDISMDIKTSGAQRVEITEEEADHNRNIEIADYKYRILVEQQQFERGQNLHFEEESKETIPENWPVELSSLGIPNSYISVGGTIWDVLSISSDATAIRFENSAIPKIINGIFSRFGSTLHRLEFLNCMVRDIEPQAFNGLVNLKELVLTDNDIQVVKSAWFEGIPSLRRLSLTRNSITKIDNGVFRLLRNLEELEISNNQLNCFEVDGLSYLTKLNAMTIANNPWSCLCQKKLDQWLDEHNDYNKDFLSEIIERDCTIDGFPNFRITNMQETNSVDNKEFDTEKEIPEPRVIEDIKEDEDFTKKQKTIVTTTENLNDMQIGDNNADLNLTATTIQKTVSTPTTENPEYSNEQCRFHQFNRMTESRWWCNGGDILVLDQIPSSAERIDIINSDIPVIPANAFIRFSNLTKLLFYNSSIRDVHPLAFATLDKLEWLIFLNNSIPSIKSSWFHGLVNVTVLGLVRNSITEIEPDVFEYLPKLERLSIEENNLRCIYTKSLSSLKYLQKVTLQGNPWKWRCNEELTQFFGARNISYVKSQPYEQNHVIKVC